MKKKIIALVLAVMTMCTTAAYAVSENVGTVTEDGNIQLNPNDDEIVYEETTDAGRIQYYLIVYTDRKEQAHAMAEAARGLGYAENHPVIQLAQAEWGLANDAFNYYQNLWNTTYENK